MRVRMVRVMTLAAVAAGWTGAPALAQNREKAWELYPSLGYVMFGSKAGLDDKPSFEFSFAYHKTKHQEIEFGFGGVSTKDTASHQFSFDLINVRANYLYNFFLQHRDRVSAFVTGGAGMLNFSRFGFNPPTEDFVGDEVDLMYNYGAGMRFFAGEKTGVRFDARQVRYKTNHAGNQSYNEFTVGMTIVLGGA
jgi:hypothetical protein